MNLCPKSSDREARRACMMEKRSQISDGCRSELMALRGNRQAAPTAPAAPPAAPESEPK
jgi:hypothetical protein